MVRKVALLLAVGILVTGCSSVHTPRIFEAKTQSRLLSVSAGEAYATLEKSQGSWFWIFKSSHQTYYDADGSALEAHSTKR